jgi:hypothetical protein
MTTEKNKVFSDLIVPFTACPFKKVEVDCPFVDYWKIDGLEEVMELIDKLPEQQLLEYREQHQVCRDWKISRGEVMTNL